jgi:DNA processing protein
MSISDLMALGLAQEEAIKLTRPNWSIVEQDLCWAGKPGNHIITINDPDYPRLLKEIFNPPLVLFVTGKVQILQS